MKRKLIALYLMACCMGATACNVPFFGGEDTVSVSVTQEEKLATIEQLTEDMAAIRVLKVQGEETVLDVMQYLQADGQFIFAENGGMITSINGKENTADWSYCWMLYTSDAEMANKEWGEIEYNGEKLGSAVLGADFLPVVEGEVYVWYYKGF